MINAREIMHVGATCVQESETLEAAARRLRELDVGFLPICGADDRLHGIITDSDIVLRCVAEGRDPRGMTAGAGRRAGSGPLRRWAYPGQISLPTQESADRLGELPRTVRCSAGTFDGAYGTSKSVGNTASSTTRWPQTRLMV